MEYVKLNNGVEMPILGFGVYQIPKEETKRCVFHASLNPELLGYHIKAFINLEVAPKDKKEFYPYIENWPNVIECNCVTGDYSMLLEVQFKSTDELDQFIGELQVYGRTKTLIVFSTSVEHREVAVQ